MKQSQLYILLMSIFFAGSFLTNHIWDSFAMLGIAFMWMIGAIFSMKSEYLLDKLKRTHERIKFEIICGLIKKRKR